MATIILRMRTCSNPLYICNWATEKLNKLLLNHTYCDLWIQTDLYDFTIQALKHSFTLRLLFRHLPTSTYTQNKIQTISPGVKTVLNLSQVTLPSLVSYLLTHMSRYFPQETCVGPWSPYVLPNFPPLNDFLYRIVKIRSDYFSMCSISLEAALSHGLVASPALGLDLPQGQCPLMNPAVQSNHIAYLFMNTRSFLLLCLCVLSPRYMCCCRHPDFCLRSGSNTISS